MRAMGSKIHSLYIHHSGGGLYAIGKLGGTGRVNGGRKGATLPGLSVQVSSTRVNCIPSFSSTSIIWGFSHGCRPPEWDAVCDWDSVVADLAPSVSIAVNRGGGRARSQA